MTTVFLFPTATHAHKARRALLSASIPSELRKVTNGSLGCTHALAVNTRFTKEAIAALRYASLLYEIWNGGDAP